MTTTAPEIQERRAITVRVSIDLYEWLRLEAFRGHQSVNKAAEQALAEQRAARARQPRTRLILDDDDAELFGFPPDSPES